MSQPAEELQPTHVERGNERGERNDDAIENDSTNNNGGRMRERKYYYSNHEVMRVSERRKQDRVQREEKRERG